MATAADDRFFRNMVTNMRNGVLAIDREGRVVMINEEACRVLEIAPDAEDTGRHFSDLLRHHHDVVRILAAAFEMTTLPNRAELRLKPTGKVIGYTLSLVRDERLRVHGAALFFKDLTYVELAGSVGVIGNGAGLVMSTLDVVAHGGLAYGGVKPANFLDIGGGASAEVMANGLEIILSDPQVKSVFVNVFGGITACDAVANGIVQAFELLRTRGESVTHPLVVRLDGNNAQLGRQILTDAALPHLEQVDTMDGAAHRAAELAATGQGQGA
jgi:hypothetical protein